MVLYLAQINSIKIDAGTTRSTVPLVDDYSFSFLFGEDLGWAAIDETIRVFFVIEVIGNLDAGHEAIEAGGDRRPFSMLLADSLLCVYLNVNLLVLSQLSNHYVLMHQLYLA